MPSKNKFIQFILCGILLGCGKAKQRNKVLTINDIIYSQTFGDNSKFHGVNLKFSNNKYEFELGSEGLYWYNEGDFIIEQDRVKLRPKICRDGRDAKLPMIPCRQTFNDGYCFIDNQTPDIEYEMTLKCISPSLKAHGLALNELSFNVTSTRRRPGDIVEIQKAKVTFLDRRTGILTATVNLRAGPSVSSAKQTYFPSDEKNGEFLDSVPSGTQVVLLGKTVSKEKVKNWENHWYLVEVGHNQNWIYGEFIKELP